MKIKIVLALFLSLSLILISLALRNQDKITTNQALSLKDDKPELETDSSEKIENLKEEPQIITKSWDEISLDELEELKDAHQPNEEFELTPSVDDLIKFKKQKIKTY